MTHLPTRPLAHPSGHTLSLLTRSGILEQGRARGPAAQPHLRVSPRFLAHAEATSARLRQQGRHAGLAHALEAALAAWDDYPHDVRPAAHFLEEFLGEHHQLGTLRPVFPSLDSWAAVAA